MGGVLFGLLAVYELDRTERGRFSLLVDGAVSPLMMALVRLPALMATAALGLGLTVVVWFPVSRQLIGSVFDGADYLLAYGLLMGLALWLSILAAASAYQFTRLVDLSLVLFTSFSALSLTVWAGDWQLCWLNPFVWALSDDFSNLRIFRSVAYMRLTWLAALAGIWAVSYLCVRRYEKAVSYTHLHRGYAHRYGGHEHFVPAGSPVPLPRHGPQLGGQSCLQCSVIYSGER